MRQIRIESTDKLNKFILSKSNFHQKSISMDKQAQERLSLDVISLNSQLQNEMPSHFKEQFKQVASTILSALKQMDAAPLLVQSYQALQRLMLQLLKNDYRDDNRESKTLREVKEIDKLKVNSLLVQNNKLAIEIKQLSNKLKELEESQDVVKLRDEIQRITQVKDEQINRLIILNDTKEKQVSKNSQLIIQLKSVIQKQDSQIQILENYLESDKKKYSHIENTYDKMVNENRHLNELCKMQEEDLTAHYIRYRHYLREEANSRKKLLMLQDEIDKMKIEKSKRPEVQKVDPEQEQKLMRLAYNFSQDKQYFKIMKELTQLNITKLSDQEQTTIMFLKHVRYDYIYYDSLSKFQYPRPSFLLFYESNMKNLEQDYRNIEFHQISILYFATIRSILDSQYNEFLYRDNQYTPVKFADFVYGWISNFIINPKTRQIEIIKDRSFEHLEPIRNDFILDCLSPKLAKLHEVIIFNELLFELSSPDELYYYLYSRFLIFKGSLSNQQRYSFEAVIFVQLNWVQQILEMLLWKYDQSMYNQINQIIIESSVTKGKGTIVDGHYVLRILLELYRTERRNRLAMLKEVFSACISVQSSGKSGVTYKNFKKIFQSNFPDVPDQEICSLFRESFMCGDGVVTAESFFTAASESCFFVKQMLLKSLIKTPIVELNEISYKESNLPFLDFYQHYKQLPHHLVQKCCLQFGLHSVIIELEELHKLIKNYFQDQYNQYSLFSTVTKLIHIYNTVIDLHMRQQNTFNKDWDQSEIESLKSLNNQLSQLFSPLIDYDQQKKLQNIAKQRKLRPLQLFVKNRVQRFYQMIANIINNNNINVADPQVAKRRFTKQSSIKML
ncbi:unnamed protein product [Paramecium pentaurelia]|uniref:Uncharacterized protein n=1 Tax=Paramecium pentaurelia TaxID=43138 RepID=A0A8S1YAV3_9CILI|nr:unnamed protein product [Paramecium pentaurelia]